MTRKTININVETNILVDSRRRCCLCFGLHRDLIVKPGQIAHLDKNNSNNNYDNLAFLCFEHHNQYDSKTSQSKNYTIAEVKRYKRELKEKFLTIDKPKHETVVTSNLTLEGFRQDEIRKALIEILTESGPISHLMSIAYKIGLSKNTVEKYLIELAQNNRVRIDRKRGTIQRTFSLVDSNENLIIDAFIKSLEKKVTEDLRNIRKNQFEIDAIIKTEDDIFVIEVKMAKYLNTDRIHSTLERINRCRQELRISNQAKNVLLIGTNHSVENLSDSLKGIEEKGVIIKFIEIQL